MGKLLRVAVVILLLLALASFGLGYMLFGKRETLRGHVTDLAKRVVELAPFIESSQDPDLTKAGNPTLDKDVEVEALLKYKVGPNEILSTNRPATMALAMDKLIGQARVQFSILNDTRQALAQKIQELDTATNRIAVLEGEVARLEGEKKQLQDNVATLEKDVAERKAKIEELNASLEETKAQVADLKDNVAKLKDQLLDKDDKIKTLEDTIKRLQDQIRGQGPKEAGAGSNLAQGTKGQILLVNKEWNFVVIGLSNPAGVGVGTELTIQRGEALVGKARITEINVQYQVAIGEQLMAPWKQKDAEVGDYVFY